MLGAHAAIVVAGLRALVGAPDHTRARAALLRAQATTGRGARAARQGLPRRTDHTCGHSVAPTWDLVYDCDIDDALLAASTRALCESYPSLAARVVPLDGLPGYARTFRWVEGPPADLLVPAATSRSP